MALEDLFGSPDYLKQLIGEEQFAKAQNQAFNQGLINASLAALAGSSQTNKLGQIIGSAGQAGVQGYQGSMDRTLSDIAKGLQMQEMVRKQKEAQQIKQLMTSAATPQYKTTPAVIPQGQTMLDDQGVPTLGTTPEQKQLTGYTYDIGKVAPALYAMGKPEVVKQIAEAQKLIDGKGELTGEYANVALGLYGTADVAKLPQNAFSTISEEIARQNKAKATQVNMPSEGERKAGTLANIIDKNIAQMQAAVGKEPKAVKPNALAESVRSITGSDYLARNLSSDQRQIIEGAQLDVLDAALTLRTGAAYTREQLEGYRKSYFPQVGEPDSVVKAKQVRLENLLDSAYMAAGRATPSRVSGKGEAVEAPPPKAMFRWDLNAKKMVENK